MRRVAAVEVRKASTPPRVSAALLADAEVTLHPAIADGDALPIDRMPRSYTDSGGLFRFAGVVEGGYRLRAERRGYELLILPLTVAERDDLGELELRLDRAEGLLLNVRYASGGRPRCVRGVWWGTTPILSPAKPYARSRATVAAVGQ